MLSKFLSLLTVIGRCSLLSVGIILFCSSSRERVGNQDLKFPTSKILSSTKNTKSSFNELVYLVTHVKGVYKTNYLNTQIVFSTKKWRYTIEVSSPYSSVPTFTVWRRPGDTSKKIESWSVDMNTGELISFIPSDGFYVDKQEYSPQEKLSKKQTKQLKYFKTAHQECVNQLRKMCQ